MFEDMFDTGRSSWDRLSYIVGIARAAIDLQDYVNVVLASNEGQSVACCSQTRGDTTIALNMRLIERLSLRLIIHVIGHEIHHAWQFATYGKEWVEKQAISGKSNFPKYFESDIEVNARFAGHLFLEKLKELLTEEQVRMLDNGLDGYLAQVTHDVWIEDFKNPYEVVRKTHQREKESSWW